MPYIKLPDGSYYQVDEGTDYMSALTQAQQKYPTAFGGAPAAKPTSGIMSALGAGFKGGLGEAAENVGAFTGIAGLQKFGQKQQEKAAASYAPTSDKDIEKASDQGLLSELGARATQFLEPYAQSAGNIAGRFGAPIAAGAAAGAGLAFAAPELAATAVGGAGLEAMGLGTVGALAGTGATALADAPIEIGQKELERKRAGLPPDPLGSTVYGLAATALNTVSGHLLSGPIQGILGKTAAQEARMLAPKVLAGDLTATEASAQLSGTLRNILQGTAENAATGTAMMLGNTALSRASVGQDLTSPEARAQYGEDIKGALTLAPMFGLAHGLGARGTAEKTLGEAGAARTAEEARTQQAADTAAAAQEELRKQSPEYIGQIEQQYADLQNNFANLKAQAAVKVEPTDLAGAARLVEAKKALKEFMADGETKKTVQEYNRVQKLEPQEVAPVAEAAAPVTETTAPATETTTPAAPAVDPRQQLADLNAKIEALQTQAQTATPEQLIDLGKQHTELKVQQVATQKAVDALPPPPPAPPTQAQIATQIKRTTTAMNKAKENGDLDVAGKHAAKLIELNKQLQAPEAAPEAASESAAITQEAAPTATTPTTPAAPKPVAAKPLEPYTGIAEQRLMFPETGAAESTINVGQGKQPAKSRQDLIAEFQAARQVRDRLGMQNAIEQMRVLAERSKARSEAARGNGVPQGELSKGLPEMLGQKLTATGSQAPSRELTNAGKVKATPESLRKQIEELPEKLSPKDEQLLNRLRTDFDEFVADPDRSDLLAGFLHDLRTGVETHRARDVANELDILEARKKPEQKGLFDGKYEKNSSGAYQKPKEALPIIEGPRRPLPIAGFSEETAGPPKPQSKPAPEKKSTLTDRENADATKRKAENERAERLASIPGESISFEAHRQALETLDDVGPRLDELVAKSKDETLPETTRNKAKREIKKLSLARKFLESTGEGNGELRLQAEEELAKLKEKIKTQEAAVAEKATVSRKKELAISKRREKELTALVKGFKSRAERTAVETPTEKTRKAEEARAERFMSMQTAIAIEGTTGKLPARKVGPVVRKAQAAANIRTGEGGEAGTETRRIGPGTKPEQGGAAKTPTLEQAVEDANKVAEEKVASGKELTATDIKMLDLRQHFALFEAAQNMRRGLERNLVELNEKMERAAQAVNPTEKNVALRKERLEQKAGIERDIAMAKKNEERLGKIYSEEPAETEEVEEPKVPKSRVQKAIEETATHEKKPIVAAESVKKTAKESPKLSEQDIAEGVAAKGNALDIKYGTQMDTTSPYHGKTYAEAARIAAEKARNPLSKKLFGILADALDSAYADDMQGRVYVTSKEGTEILEDGSKKKVTGHYHPGQNYVLTPSNKARGNATNVLLHELLHAATSRGLFTNKAFNARVENLRSIVEKWLQTPEGKEYYRKNKLAIDGFSKRKTPYGLTNTHEFLAEVFSNKGFQNLLDQIPSEMPKKSVFSRLVDTFAGFFRFSKPEERSLLHDALDITEEAMAEAQPLNAAKRWKKPEEPYGVLNAPAKYSPALKDAGEMAERVVDTERPLSEKINSNSFGRAAKEFEIKAVDQYAGVLHHAKQMEELSGSQMQFYLRMVGQRLNLLGQAVGRGFPELKKIVRLDGRNEWLYESKDGSAALVHVAQKLQAANKLTGSEAATNNLFSLYEIAKRANDVGIDKMNYSADITKAKLDKAVQQIKSVPGLAAIFDDAHESYRDFNKDGINFAVSTGAMSKELGAKLLANKDYVPYYRESPDGAVSLWMGNEAITKIGNIKDQPYLHELVGGNTRIVDFTTSSVRNANMLLDMGLRNQATKNVANELKKIGLAEIRKGQTRARPNTVQFKVDGADHYAIIESTPDMPAELLVKGMAGIPVQTSALLHMVGAPSRLLRHMFVANPISAGRILFKDTVSSAMVGGSNFDGISAAFKNVGDNLMEKRGLSGGETFTGLSEDLSKVLRQVQTGKPGWENLLAKGYAMHAKADAMTRQIRYESYRKQGLSEMQASLQALESMNFTRRGISPSLHLLSAINPFMNSQIQGVNTLVKALRGNMPFNEKLKIREKIIQRGMMLAGATILYTTLMQDDETYKKATPEQRYNNFLTPFPGLDEPLRISIPFEAGLLFKSIPEALVNYLYGHDKDAATGMRMIVQKMIPGGDSEYVPQILKPAIEVGLGKSFFTGRDIESKHEQSLVPSERSRDSTSGLATAMGHSLGLDPIMVDHLINGYTGSLGLAVTKMASSLVFGSQPGVQPEKTLSQQPVIGTLFQPKDAGNIVEEAYQTMQEAKQVQDTVKDLIAKNRVAEAKAFLEKNATEYARAELEPKFASAMNQTQKALQAIAASTTMTPAEKRVEIEKIKALKSQIAEQVMEAADRTKRP